MKQTKAYWKVHLPKLLHEVMNNETAWILKQPIQLTMGILSEMAAKAVNEKNELMIAFCGRLGLYEASEPNREGHEELQKLMDKYFK
jgi:hypothetical protein